MKQHNICIFCGKSLSIRDDFDTGVLYCKCTNCGDYKIKREAFEDLPSVLERKYKNKKHLISGYLREMTELKIPIETITNDNIVNLFTNSKIPSTTMEKLNKLLLHLYRNTNTLYEELLISIIEPYRCAIGYAKDMRELESMLGALDELQYLKTCRRGMGNIVCSLTLRGITRAEELDKKTIDSKQGFVAMWFSDSMLETFHKHISKAISDAGYDPFIIPMKEHNDDICDNIIAEIRKSKFLIADFTGQRGGAYFEAGFAYGLGLPVIWTCHKDWFNIVVKKEVEVKIDGEIKKVIIDEERFTHFDINHYNFIVWENGEELYEKLKNRIMATIPINK